MRAVTKLNQTPEENPAGTKGRGCNQSFTEPREVGISQITSDPQKWNNPGAQAPPLRIAALRGGIGGASAS